MAASNYVYCCEHQLYRMNEEKRINDVDHLISPDAINKFDQAISDLNYPDPVDHLVSSLMVQLFHSQDIEPVIHYRQKQPPYISSFVPFKIEPLPPNKQSTLQLELAEFVKAAIADANVQNRQAVQIRLIFKVRREEKVLGSRKRGRCEDEDEEELECAICIDKLKKANKAKLTPCGHAFHEDCYYKWRRRSRS